jgi:hypothetical protein
MDKRSKEFQKFKKNPVVFFYGDGEKALGSLQEIGSIGISVKALIEDIHKMDACTTFIYGAYGGFEFLERGKSWQISYKEYGDWTPIGEFDKYPQVDKYIDLLYLRAVKMKQDREDEEDLCDQADQAGL